DKEVDHLFDFVLSLKARGVGIIYISHRIQEFARIADRVTVLRDGALISTRDIAEIDHDQVIRDMVARSIEEVHVKETVPIGAPLLVTEGLTGPGFTDVSITVKRGEIVGLYGLIGAGRSEFVQSLFGRHPATAGTITLDGKPLNPRRVPQAIEAGIALVPEGRRDQGLCLNLPVGHNLNLTVYNMISRLGLVRGGEEKRRSAEQIAAMSIRTPGASELVQNLSGGNQQKVVVGKWLNHGAKLFIFDEPTVGVDIATKVEIYRLFSALLKEGAGIILISSYLPEVYDLSDILHVFLEGRLVATHDLESGDRESPHASHERVLAQAIGA
ncbi:MAG: sugar ABC transporter ATP-binding protein, partial [Pseudomonadota bacterium]